MSKKVLIITSLIIILLGSLSVCFASNDLQTIGRTNTVDYKVVEEFYNSINKTIVEDKICYELKNVDRIDNFKTLTQEKEIIEERVTNTNNLKKVISLFNDTKDLEDDGIDKMSRLRTFKSNGGNVYEEIIKTKKVNTKLKKYDKIIERNIKKDVVNITEMRIPVIYNGERTGTRELLKNILYA